MIPIREAKCQFQSLLSLKLKILFANSPKDRNHRGMSIFVEFLMFQKHDNRLHFPLHAKYFQGRVIFLGAGKHEKRVNIC